MILDWAHHPCNNHHHNTLASIIFSRQKLGSLGDLSLKFVVPFQISCWLGNAML